MSITPTLWCLILFSALGLLLGAFLWPKRRFFSASIACFGLFSVLVWLSFESLDAIWASPFTAKSIEILVLQLLCILETHPGSGAYLSQKSRHDTTSLKLVSLIATYSLFQTTLLTEVPTEQATLMLSHTFAPAHILSAMAAKATALWAAAKLVYELGPNDNEPHQTWSNAIQRGLLGLSCHSAISLALIYGTCAILLGMAWALDASSWHSLWQWDPIETLSLITLCAIMAATARPRVVWGITILLSIASIDILTSGALATDSRHAYASPSLVSSAFDVAIALVALIHARVTRPREALSTVSGTASLTLLLLICVLGAGQRLSSDVMTPFFCIIFVISAIMFYKKRRYAIICVFCAIAIGTLPLVEAEHSTFQATEAISMQPPGSVQVSRIEPGENATHATLNVADTSLNVSFKAYQPVERDTLIALPHVWRFSANDYTHQTGLSVHMTDVALSWLWLILVSGVSVGMTTWSVTRRNKRRAPTSATPSASPDTTPSTQQAPGSMQ